MSIETVLTLGLAAAILVTSFIVRLVVLTVLRVGMRMTGHDTSWLEPQRVPRSSMDREPRLRPGVRRAAGAVAAGAAAMAAGIGPAFAAAGRGVAAGLGAGARGTGRAGTRLTLALRGGARAAAAAAAALEQWADATNARLAPRTAEAGLEAQRTAAMVAKRLGLLLVTFVATVQHFASLAAAAVRRRLPSQRPEDIEPQPRQPRKVIDLDHDDDPLTSARPPRPTAGARL